jgi:hypothetical protein
MRLLAGAEIGFVSTHSASLGSLAELLGHRGLRMVMRYAYLSPTYQSAEVGLLDAPCRRRQARKGQQKGNAPRRPYDGERKWWNSRNELARRTGRFPQLVRLGLRPAKRHENRRDTIVAARAARSNRASGAIEAEQLFDPERA